MLLPARLDCRRGRLRRVLGSLERHAGKDNSREPCRCPARLRFFGDVRGLSRALGGFSGASGELFGATGELLGGLLRRFAAS